MRTRFVQLAAFAIAFGGLGQAVRSGEKDVPRNDLEFVSRALSCGILEEKLAERAASKGKSQEVREYAKRLCEDHTKANKRLMTLAAELKLGVVAGMDKES